MTERAMWTRRARSGWSWLLKGCVIAALSLFASDDAQARTAFYAICVLQTDTPEVDLVWPITDPLVPGGQSNGGINLQNPENIENDVVYDPVTGQRLPVSAGPASYAIELGPIEVR